MIGLYIVAAQILLGAIVLMAIYFHRTMKMTSYVDGVVVQSVEHEVRNRTERREETIVTCQYVVRGREYTIEHRIRGLNAQLYPPGTKMMVWYNPQVPTMAKIKR